MRKYINLKQIIADALKKHEPNAIKCEICGERYVPKKDDLYVVGEANGLFGRNLYDAIDCPLCGCQCVLKARMERVDMADLPIRLNMREGRQS